MVVSRGAGHDDDERQEEPSAIVRQMRDLQAAYAREGRTLDFECAVDAEGTAIMARDIMDAVGKAEPLSGSSSPSCHFHSQQQLENGTEDADVSSSGGSEGVVAAPQCACVGEDAAKGKNLFLISGPDGFVSAFAGPKVWAHGRERQGPVGGVVLALMKGHPKTWKDWLILKQ